MLDSPTQEVPATPVLQRSQIPFQSRATDTPLTNVSADFAVVPGDVANLEDDFNSQNNDISHNVPGTPLTQESIFRNPVNPFSTPRMLLKSPAVPKSLEQIVPSTPQGAFFPTGYTPSSSNWSKLDDHITSTPASSRRFLKARRTLRTSTLCFESPSNGIKADGFSVEMGTEQQVKNHIVDATGDNRRSPLKSSLCAIDRSNFNEMVPATFVPCNEIDGSGNLPSRNAGESEGVKDFLDMI